MLFYCSYAIHFSECYVFRVICPFLHSVSEINPSVIIRQKTTIYFFTISTFLQSSGETVCIKFLVTSYYSMIVKWNHLLFYC